MNKSLDWYDSNPHIDYQGLTSRYDYYDLFYQASGAPDAEGYEERFSAITCILRSAFTLFSRVGFILIQVGSIPVENVYVIIFYNLLEIGLVLLSYGLVGSRISFGPDTEAGWIARGRWKLDLSFKPDLDQTVIGFCGCLFATAQMSSFLVGRINLLGGMALTTLYAAVFQPLVMHWIWEETGWMSMSRFLGHNVFVKDHAGVLVLHIPSVIFGMMGALFLGRRILKLRDVDKLSYGSENVLTIVLGYFLIIVGYVVFSLPSSLYESTHVPVGSNFSAIIIMNSLLAIGGGFFMVTILQLATYRDIYRYRRMIRCMQGGVAGLISISAAVDRYTPLTAILLSTVSAACFYFLAEVLHNTALEDTGSFISSHLICGFIGVMLCPMLAPKENLGPGVEIPPLKINMLWQSLCTGVVMGASIVVSLFVFLLLALLRILRSKRELVNHKRALVIRDAMTKRAFLERLFTINSTTDYVDPGHREEYFGASESDKRVGNIPLSRGDIARDVPLKHREVLENKDAAVMSVDTELNSGWQTQGTGTGDYYDPYLDVKSFSNSNVSKRVVFGNHDIYYSSNTDFYSSNV